MGSHDLVAGEAPTQAAWFPNRRTLLIVQSTVGIVMLVCVSLQIGAIWWEARGSVGGAGSVPVSAWDLVFIGAQLLAGFSLIGSAALSVRRRGTLVDGHGIRFPGRLRPFVPWSRVNIIRRAAMPFTSRRWWYVIETNSGWNVRFNSLSFEDPHEFESALRSFAPDHVEFFRPFGDG